MESMSLPQQLLSLARELVDRNSNGPIEGDLRRGVSTAYYALFHLLVQEATLTFVAIGDVRPRVARAFDHRKMKEVCQEYARLTPNSGGLIFHADKVIPQAIVDIASEFVALQIARHEADYDMAAQITQAQAQTDVLRAEVAFLDWAAVKADDVATTFLVELLLRGLPRR